MVLSEKVDKNARLDRHSGTGLRGLPKKEGYGKYGWGKEGEIYDEDFKDEEELNREAQPKVVVEKANSPK
ncbi:culmination specific protein 45D [Heterostelium album PN500]|uniref:Culmination specific protein 45D n=1 Tax=Heterostelium pallidum (strain ATCC 26659 / Pp 5 / PN500) TaxID=670386 RepID=D3BBE1_HETP5|nr:culmination specific protein 45D [Heterostelium album PN500]EFA80974.1 culmination specific protein 45D [Heterostelium album PN500]|eukprot:XP_020433092.1 culmination specific protein 45D [Heterostelium album PN500]